MDDFPAIFHAVYFSISFATPLCLPSSKLKPLKLKAYFIPFWSFSFWLFFIQRAAAAVASNTLATTSSPFRSEIVSNNDNDFIQHVTRIVRISNDRWPIAERTRVVLANEKRLLDYRDRQKLKNPLATAKWSALPQQGQLLSAHCPSVQLGPRVYFVCASSSNIQFWRRRWPIHVV